MKEYSVQKIRAMLRIEALPLRNDASLARRIGISRSHMSRLLDGKAKPGKKVLDYLGLKAVVIYVDND